MPNMNTFLYNLFYDSPYSVELGDTFYRIVQVKKTLPQITSGNELNKFYPVKMFVNSISKARESRKLSLVLELCSTEERNKFPMDAYVPRFISTTDDEFIHTDISFEDWQTYAYSKYSKYTEYNNCDNKYLLPFMPIENIFTCEDKAVEFTDSLNNEQKQYYENIRKNNPTLPTWEELWATSEQWETNI